MTIEELDAASRRLEAAGKAADDDDVSERLARVAQKLAAWADRENGPDHGQLARIENRLHSLKEDAGASLAEDIDAAHDLVREYRSGVEGV